MVGGTAIPILDFRSERRDVCPDDFATSITYDAGLTLGWRLAPATICRSPGLCLAHEPSQTGTALLPVPA